MICNLNDLNFCQIWSFSRGEELPEIYGVRLVRNIPLLWTAMILSKDTSTAIQSGATETKKLKSIINLQLKSDNSKKDRPPTENMKT